jgi:hypothetical protein
MRDYQRNRDRDAGITNGRRIIGGSGNVFYNRAFFENSVVRVLSMCKSTRTVCCLLSLFLSLYAFWSCATNQAQKAKNLIMNNDVVEWVKEAPFDNPIAMEKKPDFSYDAWLARGRTLPHAAETLVQLLRREDLTHPSGDGMRVAYALGWIGQKGDRQAIEALIASINSKDVALRSEAAAALGRLGDASVVPTLERLLLNKHEDINLRANACIAIGRIGLPSSEKILRSALSDDDPFIVRCAEEALRLLKKGSPPVS